tara:strand:+ start:2761 stop:3351 length:591 start_codon:yes stop_codon:yes gene_type:complete
MAEIIENILEKTGGKDRSIRWFRDKIKELGDIPPRQLVREGRVSPTRPDFGRMNFFMYSPKYKDDKNVLPYYDRFPLILPVQPTGGLYTEGFMGLNFHYLSIPMRIRLLNIMSEYASDDNFDEGTRLRLTWNRIKRNQMVRPTIKRYLYEHVKTPFRVITADEMMVAVLLPVQRFVRAKETKVYADSRRINNQPRR